MEVFPDLRKAKELANLSMAEMIALLQAGPAERRDMMPVAKMASSTLASMMKLFATKRQEQGMKLALLRYASKDEAEFKKYLSLSMPELKPMIEQTSK